jgi:hypothetical protein
MAIVKIVKDWERKGKGPIKNRMCKNWLENDVPCYTLQQGGRDSSPSFLPGEGGSYNSARIPGSLHDNSNENEKLDVMHDTAGGALALDIDPHTGLARRVFGLSHCGTIFMVEPAKERTVILMHEPMFTLRHEVSMAAQTWEIPGQTEPVTNLFYTLGPANILREGSTKTALKILRVGPAIRCSDAGSQVDWSGVKRTQFGTSTTSHKCEGASLTKDQLTGANSFALGDLDLYWYGDKFTLKRFSLAVSVPCPGLSGINSAMKQWCPVGSDKDTQCMSRLPGSLQMNEFGRLLPWEFRLYKKVQKQGPSILEKQMICSRPARPTTRASPETCCVWKESSPGTNESSTKLF